MEIIVKFYIAIEDLYMYIYLSVGRYDLVSVNDR